MYLPQGNKLDRFVGFIVRKSILGSLKKVLYEKWYVAAWKKPAEIVKGSDFPDFQNKLDPIEPYYLPSVIISFRWF
jgi:hypothetical protein